MSAHQVIDRACAHMIKLGLNTNVIGACSLGMCTLVSHFQLHWRDPVFRTGLGQQPLTVDTPRVHMSKCLSIWASKCPSVWVSKCPTVGTLTVQWWDIPNGMFTVQWWNIPNVNCPTRFWQSDISKFTARTGKVRPCDTHDSVTKSDIYYNTTVSKKVWCDAGSGWGCWVMCASHSKEFDIFNNWLRKCLCQKFRDEPWQCVWVFCSCSIMWPVKEFDNYQTLCHIENLKEKSLTLSLVKFTGLQKTLSFSIEFFSCVMPPK